MPLSLACPCGKRLKVKDELAGRRVKCPHCGHAQVVPLPTEMDAPKPPPVPRRRVDEDEPAPEQRAKKPPVWVWLVGGGAAVAVLGVGFVVLLFVLGKGKNPPPQAKADEPGPAVAARPVDAAPPNAGAVPAGPKTELPGASGPWRVDLGLAGTPIKDIRIRGDFEEAPEGQRFRSGTEGLRMSVDGWVQSPLGFELVTESGPVPLPDGFAVETIRGPDGMTISVTLHPRDGGPFPDGPYQAAVLLDNKPVARLNFAIGGLPETGDDLGQLLAGTKWTSKYGDGSGYGLQFDAGGAFTATGLISSGGHKPDWLTKAGKWEGKPGTFTAFADSAEPPNLRTQFRGRYEKARDELLVLIRHQVKGEDGVVRFGGWYPIAAARRGGAESVPPKGGPAVDAKRGDAPPAGKTEAPPAGKTEPSNKVTLSRQVIAGQWDGTTPNGTVQLSFTDNRVVITLRLNSGLLSVAGMNFDVDPAKGTVGIDSATAKWAEPDLVLNGTVKLGLDSMTFNDVHLKRSSVAPALLPDAELTGTKGGRPLVGHTDTIFRVTFRPDGQRLASASWDTTARTWDPATGKSLVTLTGHTDILYSVAYSPNGLKLATASLNGPVKIWDALLGTQLKSFRAHPDSVVDVAWDPTGKRLATAGGDKVVKIWDTTTWKELQVLRGHTAVVHSLAWSPDGKRLASSGNDQTVRVWDAESGEEVLTLKGHVGSVYGVAWSPDGKRLASGDGHGPKTEENRPGVVRVWDAKSGKEVATLRGHTQPVCGVAWAPDSKRVASVSSGLLGIPGEVKVWDVETRQVTRTLSGHTDGVYGVAWSSDGKRLATSGADKTIRLWDMDADSPMKEPDVPRKGQ